MRTRRQRTDATEGLCGHARALNTLQRRGSGWSGEQYAWPHGPAAFSGSLLSWPLNQAVGRLRISRFGFRFGTS
jgi:hypothetical protein